MRSLPAIVWMLLSTSMQLHAVPAVSASAVRVPAPQDAALPGDPGELAKQIRQARRLGDSAPLLARLSDVPSRILRDERVHGERLQALLDLHRFDEADKLSRVNVSSGQGMAIPLAVALTRLAFRRGDIEKAEQKMALVRKSKATQKDLEVLELRIAIYKGDYKAASRALGSLRDSIHTALAVELEVDLAVARATELMGAADMLDQAVPLLERSVGLAPERMDARSLYVRALARWQRAELAETVARQGLELSQGPERAELLYSLGFLYLSTLREEQAVKLFEEALEWVPSHGLALVGLARSRLRADDMDGARDLITRSLAEDAGNLDALLLLSEIESAQADWEAAAEALESVLEIKPRHLKGLWLLSRVRARQQRLDEVQELVRRYEERKQVLADRG